MDILQELDQVGAVLLDKHFVYKSGKHGSGYINMDPLFTNVLLTRSIAYELTRPFWQNGYDTVAAPAVGGIVLSVLTALESPRTPATYPAVVWADKDGDNFVFERAGFLDNIRGKQVLVVEDLLTTGDSVTKVCRQVEQNSGEVVGVSVVVNRGGVTAEDLGVTRLESLANVSFEAIDADTCPLCEQGVSIVEDIGHGADYKREHPDYPGGYIKLLS
jgi:orotate phosphoribosyltransferase